MTARGQGEDAGATGDFDISDDLEIVGDGSPGTVIDGAHADTVIQILSGNVVISDVTIEHGGHPLEALQAGGGDIVNSGDLTLNNSVITGGQASGGAGIKNNGTLTVNRSTITRNVAHEIPQPEGSLGGGILSIRRQRDTGGRDHQR